MWQKICIFCEKKEKNIKNFENVLKVTFQYVIMIVLKIVSRRFAARRRQQASFLL